MNRPATIWAIVLVISVAGIYLIVRLYAGLEPGLKEGSQQLHTEYIGVSHGQCISCHQEVVGMAPGHREVECSVCHLGDNTSQDLDSAHAGMITIPGNAADMQQTCGLCHADAVTNIQNSIMTTNSGIINVDKYIFGEQETPNGFSHMAELGHSAADEHLRDLCAHCHIGSIKTEPGPVSQLSRGGGCNACHLNYSEEGVEQHKHYELTGELPRVHPSLDLNVSDEHCFGCHSRSGRISTNYQGYHETLLKENELVSKQGYQVLEDDRVFKYIQEDLHHAKGLSCIDCHNYTDVMGDGKLYQHEEEAVKIACEDCHNQTFTNTVSYDSLDFINKRIVGLRMFDHIDKPLLATAKESTPLLNTYVENGAAKLIGKADKQLHALLPPSSSCSRNEGHQSLTCSSCHTSWAPQCIGCHISYDSQVQGYDLLEKKFKDGAWIEYAGEFLAGTPTLGVREGDSARSVEVAIPGMIMTWDKSSYEQGKETGESDFYRLFAPAKPHTTSAKGRDCQSCHNNSLALGYGRGELKYKVEGNTGRWYFSPEYADLHQDGLPADSWIGFLGERHDMVSTRDNFRPFTLEEQKRILTVGACLTCHSPQKEPLKSSLEQPFSNLLSRTSAACVLPSFE